METWVEWDNFIKIKATEKEFTPDQSKCFQEFFGKDNIDFEQNKFNSPREEIDEKLKITEQDRKKRLTLIYNKFQQECEFKNHQYKYQYLIKHLKKEYQEWSSQINQQPSSSTTQKETRETEINWHDICEKILQHQKRLTTNPLLHDNEEAKKEYPDVYIELGLVYRKKRENPEPVDNSQQGSEIYRPKETEKIYSQQQFFSEVLDKRKAKRIAIIGEPGAGKTTLLQKIADYVLKENLGFPLWISLSELAEYGKLDNIEEYIFSLLTRHFSPLKRETAKQELTTYLETNLGNVWLLLDGLDEVTTVNNLLSKINHQLGGWLGNSRVIVTCRFNLWDGDLNYLSDFETYRLLDYEYPQQVHEFIDKFFKAKSDLTSPTPLTDEERNKRSTRLKTALSQPEKASVRDLIRNPLRLTLLCYLWLDQEKLPDTQAQLYDFYRDYFYKWKSFSLIESEKQELNEALGKLALTAINQKKSRFLLKREFVTQELGDKWFEKATQISWLNQLGDYYAFYHATFQEYFAALAIADWDDFLPRLHQDKPVDGKEYRIFDPKWKQVILFWLGREDIDTEEKEAFIDALMNFNDGCNHIYGYRAVFLAASGVGQFQECRNAKAIVETIVKWGFGFWDEEQQKWIIYLNPIAETANDVVTRTIQNLIILQLIGILNSCEDEYICWLVADSLGKIDPGNPKAISTLIQVVKNCKNRLVVLMAANSLTKIAPTNQEVFSTLIKFLISSKYEWGCKLADDILRKIDPTNQKAIAALIALLLECEDESIRIRTAQSWKIDLSNQETISGLITLLNSSQDESTLMKAAYSLKKIEPGNKSLTLVVSRLKTNLTDAVYKHNDELYEQSFQVIWQCAANLPYPDFYQAWHS